MPAENPKQPERIPPSSRPREQLQQTLTLALREHFRNIRVEEPPYLASVVAALVGDYTTILHGSPGESLRHSTIYPLLDRVFLGVLQRTLHDLTPTLSTLLVQTELNKNGRIKFTNLKINAEILQWYQSTHVCSCRADLTLALGNNKANWN